MSVYVCMRGVIVSVCICVYVCMCDSEEKMSERREWMDEVKGTLEVSGIWSVVWCEGSTLGRDPPSWASHSGDRTCRWAVWARTGCDHV